MNFRPLHDRVLVRRIEADEKTAGGIILTGDTKDRASPVRRFQAQEAPLFLISLKAGGTGRNLTAAEIVRIGKLEFGVGCGVALEQLADMLFETGRVAHVGMI